MYFVFRICSTNINVFRPYFKHKVKLIKAACKLNGCDAF